jgi:hypothetical protein
MAESEEQYYDEEGNPIDQNGDLLFGSEGITDSLSPNPMAGRVSGGSRGDALLQVLAQDARTGSQGEPRPSYAADIAGARNRISRILASGLRGLEETSGLERVGQAAMQTLAGQGRISFPQAEAAAQQQDLSRAYNIANALSGLAKSEGAGQLTASQRANLLMRGEEGERRERTNFSNNTMTMIRSAVANLENPGEGIAFIDRRMRELGAKLETPLDKLAEIRGQVLGELSSQRFRTKKEGKGGGGGVEAIGFPLNEDGTPNFFASIGKPKSATERAWNAATPVQRRMILERAIEKATGEGESAGFDIQVGPEGTSVSYGKAGDKAYGKAVADYEVSREAFEAVKPVISRMNAAIDQFGASQLGPVGALSQGYRALSEQVGALFGGNLPKDLKGSEQEIASRFNSVMAQAGMANTNLAQVLSKDTSAAAATMKTNLIFLTYYVAKILDSRGAISNGDVKTIMSAVGDNWGSPTNAKASLSAALQLLQDKVDAKEAAVKRLAPRKRGEPATPAQPAAPAAGAPQQPAASSDPAGIR